MEGLLSFLIVFIFLIVTIVSLFGMQLIKKTHSNETFNETFSNKIYTNANFTAQSPTKSEKIDLLYSPIICRPSEHSGRTYSSPCTNELYPMATSPFGKGEMASPCNPEIEARYYAMRPIVHAETYDKMLEILFKHIIDKVPEDIPIDNLIYADEFCNGDCYKEVMEFISNKIQKSTQEIKIFKDYAKNDTWGGEKFVTMNEKLYSFSNHDNSSLTTQQRAKIARYGKLPGPKKFVASFTLFNLHRYTSTDIIAIVYSKNDKYYLDYIDFSTKVNNKDDGGVQGQYMGNSIKKVGTINLNNSDIPENDDNPNWIYGNTIHNKTFNAQGFYDAENPENNILIPGGIPDKFKKVLENCDQSSLMENDTVYTNEPIYPLYPDEKIKWSVKV